jgi:hypothetical protein
MQSFGGDWREQRHWACGSLAKALGFSSLAGVRSELDAAVREVSGKTTGVRGDVGLTRSPSVHHTLFRECNVHSCHG